MAVQTNFRLQERRRHAKDCQNYDQVAALDVRLAYLEEELFRLNRLVIKCEVARGTALGGSTGGTERGQRRRVMRYRASILDDLRTRSGALPQLTLPWRLFA